MVEMKGMEEGVFIFLILNVGYSLMEWAVWVVRGCLFFGMILVVWVKFG